MRDTYPVLLRCDICATRIASTAAGAWVDAIDHALDAHRAALLADPVAVQDQFTVSAGDELAPLRRACRTGGVR